MSKEIRIKTTTSEDTTNLALDTIQQHKQALIFVNSKRSAEATAEKIAKKQQKNPALHALAQELLGTNPTKQCQRLAYCIERNTAFHHAGLTNKQKTAVEEAFLKGTITTIAATPTLCLAPGTKIWSGMDEIPVEKLSKKPLHVLEENNIIQIPNKEIIPKNNASSLIQITCSSGRSIQTTKNHRFYIKRNNKKVLVEAKNIQKTDKIATIGNITIPEKKRTVNEFTKKYPCPKKYILDEEIAHFIGLMLGDGYSGATIKEGELLLKGSGCLVSHDKEIRDVAKNISNKFNLQYRSSQNMNNVPQVHLSKTNWLREFLARCGVCQSTDKHITKKLHAIPKQQAAALLRGYFDADGYVQKSGSVGISSISLRLIRDVQKMLLRFNIPTRFRVRPASRIKGETKQYETKKQYELTIAHTQSIQQFIKHIGFSLKRKKKELIRLHHKQTTIQSINCTTCKYAITKNLFDGRTKEQKKWGKQKEAVITVLGDYGELGSQELTKILGFSPRKNETRINAHYALIQKRKIPFKSVTEWYWSLNAICAWIYAQLKKKSFDILDVLNNTSCPVCKNELKKTILKKWRSDDMDGDIFWDVIREIREVPVQETVYDVVLPPTPKNKHLFVAEGFFTHNSIGMDLPAFRTIIRDTKRFGQGGMTDIPVLEYLQMAGRAGRPDFNEEYGEAILIAKDERHAEQLTQQYIYGEPESIYSKVSAQPILRTYCLSLIASEFVSNTQELYDFFKNTFFAHQYQDIQEIQQKISEVLHSLKEWGFIASEEQNDFVSAYDVQQQILRATLLGKRVSELYLDPLSAHTLIRAITTAHQPTAYAWIHLLCSTAETKPYLRIKIAEYEEYHEIATKERLLVPMPSMYDHQYETYLETIKTANLFHMWIQEHTEEYILETYSVRPGELHSRLAIIDWLAYSAAELARILKQHQHIQQLHNLRQRLKYGVKEELLALLKLQGIGRIRARKLHKNGVRDIGGVKTVSASTLSELLGPALAKDIKKQVGIRVDEQELSPQKRTGQLSLQSKKFH